MRDVALVVMRFVLAAVFFVMAWSLPDLGASGTEAERATRAAQRQVADVAKRLAGPTGKERLDVLLRLAEQNERMRHALNEIDLDARPLEEMRNALAAVADGLTAMATLLDETPAQKVGMGLGEAADYLDQQVVSAEAAAKQLEETSDLLHTDSLLLAELLRGAPLDLDAVQRIHDALGSFISGTDALGKVLELPRLPAIRDGLHGLETSMSAGARQVDSLSSYTYPTVYWEGWRPRTQYQRFWPTGTEIAGGLNEAARGIQAADMELATLGNELPKVRAAVASSKEILEQGRDSLATVLRYRPVLETLVRSLPETAARLAEDLPKLSKELATTLRETRRLKEVAKGLRASQAQIEKAVAAWPVARTTLFHATDGLKAHREELDRLLHAKYQIQSANGQLRASTDGIRGVMPGWAENVSTALATEQQSMQEVAANLGHHADVQAHQTRQMAWFGWTLRVALVGMGVFLLVTVIPSRPFGSRLV